MNFLRLGLTQPGANDNAEMTLLANQEAQARADSANVGAAAANLLGTGLNIIGQNVGPGTPEIMPTEVFSGAPQQSPAQPKPNLLDNYVKGNP